MKHSMDTVHSGQAARAFCARGRRWIIACLALALLLALAGCSSSEDGDAAPDGPTGDGAVSFVRLDGSLAVERIPEFNGVGWGDSLLAVKHYGDAIGWVEVNQIANLERMDHTAEGGYYLLVPRYVGSRLTVASAQGELLYEKAETPDDFALIVNADPAGDGAGMLATLECEAGTATFNFAGTADHGGSLPLLTGGAYYTEPGHTADESLRAQQTGGAVTGTMRAEPGEEVWFTVTMPDDCALGDSDGAVQSFFWRGHTLTMRAHATGQESPDPRAYLAGGDGPTEVAPGLWRADSRADVPAYAFADADLVVVLQAPWTVPALDGDWDALAQALADSFAVLERTAG